MTGRLRVGSVLVTLGAALSLVGGAAPAACPAPDAREAAAVRVARALAGVGAGDVVRCTFRFTPAGLQRSVAVAFADRRTGETADTPRRVRDGGVVELFRSPAEVAARADQLAYQARQAQRFGFDEGGQPLRREHLLRSGPVLLRLSAQLTETVVREYARALDSAVSAPPTQSSEPPEEAPCST